MFSKFIQERQAKKLVQSMAKKLVADYGTSRVYTEGQVRTAFTKLQLKSEHEEFALALFCDEKIVEGLKVDKHLVQKYKWDVQGLALGYGANGISGRDAGDCGDASE